MAEKPRVKAPKKRGATKSDEGRDKRPLLVLGAIALTAVVVAGGFFLLGSGGGSGSSSDDARAALTSAGCDLEVKAAALNSSDHSDSPDPDEASAKWNTDPPTSGPHYGVTLIYGSYTEPVQLSRVLHNLEHGAVYVLYGDDV